MFAVSHLLNHIERLGRQRHRSGKLLGGTEGKRKSSWSKTRRRQSVVGIIRRTCSIQIDPSELPGELDYLCFLFYYLNFHSYRILKLMEIHLKEDFDVIIFKFVKKYV